MYKLEAIKKIHFPTQVHNVRSFGGLINYYRNMWRKRANTLSPLTKICSAKVKFKWNDVDNNSFIATKKIVGRDVLLSYPNFSKRFIFHTEASKTQLGGGT